MWLAGGSAVWLHREHSPDHGGVLLSGAALGPLLLDPAKAGRSLIPFLLYPSSVPPPQVLPSINHMGLHPFLRLCFQGTPGNPIYVIYALELHPQVHDLVSLVTDCELPSHRGEDQVPPPPRPPQKNKPSTLAGTEP